MTGKASAYLLVGDDEYPRSKAARELIDKMVPGPEQAFGLEIIEGKADGVDDAIRRIKACRDAILTAGFLMTGGKWVWWRDVSFLAEGPAMRSEEVKAQLKQLAGVIQSLPGDGNSLLITASGIDRRSSLFKVFKEHHHIREFTLPEKSREIEQYVRTVAHAALSERGLKASDSVLLAFLQRAGADARQISGEAEKLDLYVGARREVTEEDVQAVVCASSSAGMWAFLDALSERQAGKALAALRDMLTNKESPVGIVVMAASRLRDIALYREAMDRGWVRFRSGGGRDEAAWGGLRPEVELALSTGLKRDPRLAHPFVMVKLCRQASRFSAAHIHQAQRVAAETHEKLVSCSLPERYLLDLMVIRIVREPGIDRG
jgi:DNA polymerase-3 subunit delta